MLNYYAISAIGDGEDIPLFFDAEWKPELPEFDYVSNSPSSDDFHKRYQLKAGLENLEVDIILEQFLASCHFVDLCVSFSCSFIAIPVDVSLTKKKIKDRYFFFCPTERLSILDVSRSEYELMDERLLRPAEERPNNLPVYERIDLFVVKSDICSEFFFCEELKQFVCSEKFKQRFEEQSLVGLDFNLIDSNFTYASWDGF